MLPACQDSFSSEHLQIPQHRFEKYACADMYRSLVDQSFQSYSALMRAKPARMGHDPGQSLSPEDRTPNVELLLLLFFSPGMSSKQCKDASGPHVTLVLDRPSACRHLTQFFCEGEVADFPTPSSNNLVKALIEDRTS